MITRLHVAPLIGTQQQIFDVPEGMLVLDVDGMYRDPMDAMYVVVRNAQTGEQDTYRICYREQLDEDPFYPSPIIATDPTGGECVCLITCPGVRVPVTTTIVTT